MKFGSLQAEFSKNAPVITVGLETRVGDAIRQMRQHNIHHLVVSSPEGVLGIVSDRQIFAKALTEDGAWNPLYIVKDVYTPLNEALSDASDMGQALDLMEKNGCTAMPIVRSGKLIGIVSESDVIRILHRWLRSEDLDAEARSQLILSNPLVANLLQMLAEAGI